MTNLQPFWHQQHQNAHRDTSIIDALGIYGEWHGDISPLGATGDYALDMMLADAFRMMLFRPDIKDRLDWIQREVAKAQRRPRDRDYVAELASWWLDLWDAAKAPPIDERISRRRLQCVS
ncbi:hypothetical protein [Mesorhizobium sp.]|uniref:hypothetical protein n=1 Tax=Mesorhizobium sp. TaxID=1871066 RepID=UPI000FE6A5A3|nr:hypothetical protein [Mesorhizobium sp.]RWB67570.1 MAG: hypothetical protein EOQ49_24945 [Mesorhizobium sp.]